MGSDMHSVSKLSICYTVPVADTPSAPLHYRCIIDASKLKLQKEQMFSFTSVSVWPHRYFRLYEYVPSF